MALSYRGYYIRLSTGKPGFDSLQGRSPFRLLQQLIIKDVVQFYLRGRLSAVSESSYAQYSLMVKPLSGRCSSNLLRVCAQMYRQLVQRLTRSCSRQRRVDLRRGKVIIFRSEFDSQTGALNVALVADGALNIIMAQLALPRTNYIAISQSFYIARSSKGLGRLAHNQIMQVRFLPVLLHLSKSGE